MLASEVTARRHAWLLLAAVHRITLHRLTLHRLTLHRLTLHRLTLHRLKQHRLTLHWLMLHGGCVIGTGIRMEAIELDWRFWVGL